MKNAKKILLFLGAISLVAFGSFNMTGNKSNKNTVAESKETETDKKENKRTIANYKELYRDILDEYYNNTLYEYTFRLEDITGDGQDELIVKEDYLANDSFYYIYEVKGDKVNKIFDGSCSELSFLEDGSILDSYENNYDNDPTGYYYYVYDKDISRFRLEKRGRYRKGDKEYFDKLANKPVKLYGWDVDTELNLSNIDEALR